MAISHLLVQTSSLGCDGLREQISRANFSFVHGVSRMGLVLKRSQTRCLALSSCTRAPTITAVQVLLTVVPRAECRGSGGAGTPHGSAESRVPVSIGAGAPPPSCLLVWRRTALISPSSRSVVTVWADRSPVRCVQFARSIVTVWAGVSPTCSVQSSRSIVTVWAGGSRV